MDPFKLATDIAGLISLAKDVFYAVQPYISGVMSAEDDMSQLQLRIRALGEVLGQFKDLLESEDADELSFAPGSARGMVRRDYQRKLTGIYKRLKRGKPPSLPKATDAIAMVPIRALSSRASRAQEGGEVAKLGLLNRLLWPVHNGEVVASCAKLQEHIQTFHFRLSISHCKLLSRSSRMAVKMLNQLRTLAQGFSPIPERMTRILDEMNGVLATSSALERELHDMSAAIQDITAQVESTSQL